MAKMTLKQMRERYLNKERASTRDNSVYTFWNAPFDATTTIRLLPWYDEVSDGFWTESKVIPMSFVDPNNSDRIIKYNAPSLRMYLTPEEQKARKCPVLAEVSALYNEANKLNDSGNPRDKDRAELLTQVGKQHWLDVKFYYQGFVVTSGYSEENVPENPIRVFQFQKQIHEKIYDSVFKNTVDPFDFLPVGEFDLDDVHALMEGKLNDSESEEVLASTSGYNYLLKKSKLGGRPNYTNSTWAKNATQLTDQQLEQLHQYGYHDLRKRLLPRPSDEQYELLVDMVKVSIARALGEDEGHWNPEWTEAGIRPFYARENNDAEEEKVVSQVVTAKPTVRPTVEGSVSERVKAAVRRTPPVKAEEPVVEESVQELAEEDKSNSTPSSPVDDRISALRARLMKNKANA